jgi:phosphohistidine phosphatase
MTTSTPEPRTLILLRHAKSSWPDVADHDRPLAPRGLRDAPLMGSWLRASGRLPDQVLCSSARRTRETWQLVHEQLEIDPQVSFDEQVYGTTPGRLLDLIRQVDPVCRTLLVVGHDPAVPGLARTLPAAPDPEPAAGAGTGVKAGTGVGAGADEMREKFPTAGVAVLEFAGTWDGLELGAAVLVSFVTPHDLLGGGDDLA